jgi:hypothetical protein
MTKPIIASLAFAAAFGFPAATIAQPAGMQPRLSPQPQAVAQVETEAQARSAEVRRAWLASGHKLAAPAASGTCQITAGTLVTTTLNVAKQPAAPEISVTYQNCNPGFAEIEAVFNSASTPSQLLETSFTLGANPPPSTQGTIKFKQIGNPYGFGQFNPYSAAGTWSLRDIYIRDLSGTYTHYDHTALAALFNTLDLTLTNNGKPDTAPPQINSGQILTPQVSISSHPYFFAKLDISDDASGLERSYVAVKGPGGSPQVLYYNYPHQPFRHTTVKAYDYMGRQTATGTWTIYAVQACDVASNCTYIADPAGIQTLFGTDTFELVN